MGENPGLRAGTNLVSQVLQRREGRRKMRSDTGPKTEERVDA